MVILMLLRNVLGVVGISGGGGAGTSGTSGVAVRGKITGPGFVIPNLKRVSS